MDSRKRNLSILIALVVGWGLIFAFRSPWGTSAKPEPRGSVATPARPAAAQGGGILRLKKELLDLPRPAYPPEVQNFFGSPPPLRPAQPATTGPTSAAPPAPPPPDPFQEEAKRLRFVGFVEAGDRAMAFIVKGTEVYTAEVGATIPGGFRVQAVTEDAVLLSSATGDKQVRLPLTAEASTAPKR